MKVEATRGYEKSRFVDGSTPSDPISYDIFIRPRTPSFIKISTRFHGGTTKPPSTIFFKNNSIPFLYFYVFFFVEK